MEVQEQLDRQFALEPTSTHLYPLESNSIAMSKDIQSLRDKTTESTVPFFPGGDQDTTTAMNNLALKHGPRQDKETLQVSKGNSRSTSLKSRQSRVPEIAPARSRKRKSPEPLETELAPPFKQQAGAATTRAVTKPVSGQLSRPTDPLNARKLQPASRDNSSRNKYDIPDDVPTPRVRPRKPEQPTGQAKKARGRPRKTTPEALPNKDPVANRALIPKVTRAESSLHPQRSHTGEPASMNQLTEQSSLPDVGRNPSRETAPLDEAQEESPEENEKSDVTRTNGQRRTELVDDAASDRITVPDSMLGSEEDEGSIIVEDEGGKSSDEDSSHQGRSSEAVVSEYDAELSHDNVFEESDGSNEEVDFELFGGIESWESVIEGVKEVGVSRRKGVVISRGRPKITTEAVQDLVTLMQKLASLYREVGVWSERDSNHETAEVELRDLREELYNAVDEISDSNASEHDSYLVQDIYAHAIPSMVFMLKAALTCRSRLYSEPDDTEFLEEVVEIQDAVIHLCEKARRWKARPIVMEPIMGAVARNVLPSMRNLKERYFDRELASRTDSAWQRSREARFARSYKRACEQRKLDKERHHQLVLERRRMIFEQLEEKPRAKGSRSQKSHIDNISKVHRRSHSITSDQWTKKQNEDLVEKLLSEESRDLPGKSALVL